ncbi:MAG: hypothetical protein N4A74_25385 [Carboxylicivirga sp.]|jgi:hypothetical protein|nr:hypothetical protein [Carboxylicivirga sp.]
MKYTLHYITFLLLFFGCKPKENIYDRDSKMINEYHKKMIESKADSTYFIEKNEIKSVILRNHIEIVKSEIKSGDNISFCDTNGNIRYQAIIEKIQKEKIFIRCLDLKKIKYYKTEFNFDSIRDLEKDYPYRIRYFR